MAGTCLPRPIDFTAQLLMSCYSSCFSLLDRSCSLRFSQPTHPPLSSGQVHVCDQYTVFPLFFFFSVIVPGGLSWIPLALGLVCSRASPSFQALISSSSSIIDEFNSSIILKTQEGGERLNHLFYGKTMDIVNINFVQKI